MDTDGFACLECVTLAARRAKKVASYPFEDVLCCFCSYFHFKKGAFTEVKMAEMNEIGILALVLRGFDKFMLLDLTITSALSGLKVTSPTTYAFLVQIKRTNERLIFQIQVLW